MISCGKKVTVSAFPANTPLALNLWLPCEARELCQEVTLCDCQALWEFKIMSVGFYQSRPREEGLDIVFEADLWTSFLFCGLKTLGKKKKIKLSDPSYKSAPPCQSCQNLKGYAPKKFTVVIQVVAFWVSFIFFVLFCTFFNIYFLIL